MIKNNKEQYLKKSEKIFAENFHIFIICLFDLKRVVSGVDYLELFSGDIQSEKEETDSGYEVMIIEDKIVEKRRKIIKENFTEEEETIRVSSRKLRRGKKEDRLERSDK